MSAHRLILVAVILTLLGLDLVFLQVQRVRIGYRVAQESERLQGLQEAVRLADVQANKRRDPLSVRMRGQARGLTLDTPVAGRVIRFAPGVVRIVLGPPGAEPAAGRRPPLLAAR